MNLRFITDTDMIERPVAEARELLDQNVGVVWLDVPVWSGEAAELLRETFGLSGAEIALCSQRNRVATFKQHRERAFIALHAPQRGAPGHVHSIELDQFVAERYLVTVHGPLSPSADPASARVEVDALERLLGSGRLAAKSAYELSHALTAALGDRLNHFVAQLTGDLWDLEYRFQAVVADGPSSRLVQPEQFLDELFRARHGFVVARTQSATAREVFARMHRVAAFGQGDGQRLLADTMDEFVHLCATADVEKENLQGTIEFYQARTNTELTVAAERLAVIAAITLPITAVSSILGMNLIVNDKTDPWGLGIALLSMTLLSALLLRWARRQGWW
jgi:Mg2+ and Co2+ transporter CorA